MKINNSKINKSTGFPLKKQQLFGQIH